MSSYLDQSSDKIRITELEVKLHEAEAELVAYRKSNCSDIELETQESEERFRCLAEASFEGLAIHQDLTMTEVNESLVNMSGYSRIELIGMPALRLIAPEYQDLVRTNIHTGYKESYEVVGIRKDGTRLAVELQGKNALYKRQPVRVVAVRDISDRKAAETALIECERRYQVLFNSKCDSVVIHGLTEEGLPDKFLEVNDAACQNLGYTRAELLQLSLCDITLAAPVENIVENLYTHKSIVFETIHVTKDGRRFPVEVKADLFEYSGKPSVISFARDISDRKAVEAALLESQRRYEILFNNRSEAVFIQSPTKGGKFIEVNDAACQSLGYTREELLQLSPKDITPADFVCDPQIFRDFVTHKHAIAEIMHLDKDGRKFPVEIRFIQLTDAIGIPLVMAFARDISDRKAAAAKLEEANYQLQRLASLDYMTQVANRRTFDKYLESEWLRLTREQKNLSVIMCDVDCFKLYNDGYGHPAGDECLQKVAAAIALAVKRPADLVARYGGEEFTVVLPNTDNQGAIDVAERIRHMVKSLAIPHEFSTVSEYVTISLGVSTLVPNASVLPAIVVNFADHALYQAKELGRDRVYSIG